FPAPKKSLPSPYPSASAPSVVKNPSLVLLSLHRHLTPAILCALRVRPLCPTPKSVPSAVNQFLLSLPSSPLTLHSSYADPRPHPHLRDPRPGIPAALQNAPALGKNLQHRGRLPRLRHPRQR